MIPGIYSSLSGVFAAQAKINATSHNVANSNTDGFKRHRVVFQESQAQGVGVNIERDNTPGPEVLEETPAGPRFVEQSNVDLGEESVNLLLGRRFMEANVNALKTQDKLIGTLLDIME